jgi:uncharacterized protein
MMSQPLTEEEFDRLNEMLEGLGAEFDMNLERLDGFLSAMACGPGHVLPSEFLPEIWGGGTEQGKFATRQMLQDFLFLLMRHWNAILDVLRSDEVFLPLLHQDESGVALGNDWANGFMRGMDLRRAEWGRFMDDERHGGWLVPILALAHEHDPDPELRPYSELPSKELRERLIVGISAGVMGIYRHFEKQRLRERQALDSPTVRRIAPKTRRNDPCPCGSGRKFKQCCGGGALH